MTDRAVGGSALLGAGLSAYLSGFLRSLYWRGWPCALYMQPPIEIYNQGGLPSNDLKLYSTCQGVPRHPSFCYIRECWRNIKVLSAKKDKAVTSGEILKDFCRTEAGIEIYLSGFKAKRFVDLDQADAMGRKKGR